MKKKKYTQPQIELIEVEMQRPLATSQFKRQ